MGGGEVIYAEKSLGAEVITFERYFNEERATTTAGLIKHWITGIILIMQIWVVEDKEEINRAGDKINAIAETKARTVWKVGAGVVEADEWGEDFAEISGEGEIRDGEGVVEGECNFWVEGGTICWRDCRI